MTQTNTPTRFAGTDQGKVDRSSGAKEEVRNGVAYLECRKFSPRAGAYCPNMLPLDRFGRFEGKCGKCGWIGVKRAWWLSTSQREFRAVKATLRMKVESGEGLSLSDFDFIAKDFI